MTRQNCVRYLLNAGYLLTSRYEFDNPSEG